MTEPMFLKPVFQEKIWGGDRLNTVYGYDIPSDHTGECWAISAHKHGPATVINGPYKGMTLDEVWNKHREAFGNAEGDVFPLLTKILDAKKDLSVQVHPDDAYAEEHEHELGKTECWYILAADEGAQMYYGHHANSREELAEMIENHEWDKLLRKVPVKPGDFLYVPSGTSWCLKRSKALTRHTVFMILIALMQQRGKSANFTLSNQSTLRTFRMWIQRLTARNIKLAMLRLRVLFRLTSSPSTDGFLRAAAQRSSAKKHLIRSYPF